MSSESNNIEDGLNRNVNSFKLYSTGFYNFQRLSTVFLLNDFNKCWAFIETDVETICKRHP